MKFLILLICAGWAQDLNLNIIHEDDAEKDNEVYISPASVQNAPSTPTRVNQVKMNKRIREKIQFGHFNEETYKQCIADELLKSGNSLKQDIVVINGKCKLIHLRHCLPKYIWEKFIYGKFMGKVTLKRDAENCSINCTKLINIMFRAYCII